MPLKRDNVERYDGPQPMTLPEFTALAFSPPVRPVTLPIAAYLTVVMGLAVWIAVLFFRTDSVWYLICYATCFLTLMLFAVAGKIFLWQSLNRRCMERRIEKLERLLGVTGTPQAPHNASVP